jgi:two-component system alkaline phosphatase synthesis response regulator PhoP
MSKKILIVDDEPDILKVIVFRLKKLGYEIITAVEGEGALDLIKDEKPDLIILDLRLPKKCGNEICLDIKKHNNLKDIPVIIVTASSDKIKEIAKDCQADDYILKPFDSEEFINKIKGYFE